MNLLIFGPQGCGKGTQADKLSEKYNLVHIETGQIFREIARENTPLGKKISDLNERKEMIPDDIVVEILENKFRFDSSSTAKAVIELCNFYRNTKTISLDRIKVKKTQNRSWFSRLFY